MDQIDHLEFPLGLLGDPTLPAARHIDHEPSPDNMWLVSHGTLQTSGRDLTQGPLCLRLASSPLAESESLGNRLLSRFEHRLWNLQNVVTK